MNFVMDGLLKNRIPSILMFLREYDTMDDAEYRVGSWYESNPSYFREQGLYTPYVFSGTLEPDPRVAEVFAAQIRATEEMLLETMERALAAFPHQDVAPCDEAGHFCRCLHELFRIIDQQVYDVTLKTSALHVSTVEVSYVDKWTKYKFSRTYDFA